MSIPDRQIVITRLIEDILRQEDPLSLIEAGAPLCEYDIEVPYLMNVLKETKSLGEFKTKLPKFFFEQFGLNLHDGCSLATKIWSAYGVEE
jgi:hypothetical protein